MTGKAATAGKTRFTNKRPQRLKKSDRLISGEASADEQKIHMALAPFDGMVRYYDRKYGVDCLPELTGDPELCGKYGSALAKLNAAVVAGDYETVVKYVGVCMRGMEKMEAVAIEKGAQPADGRYWSVEMDGQVYAVLLDERSWQTAQEVLPDAVWLSQREIALAIKLYREHHIGQFVTETKKHFPGAEVMSKVEAGEIEDPIPF